MEAYLEKTEPGSQLRITVSKEINTIRYIAEQEKGYLRILRKQGKYYLEAYGISVLLNGRPVEELILLSPQDLIQIGANHSFRFMTVETTPTALDPLRSQSFPALDQKSAPTEKPVPDRPLESEAAPLLEKSDRPPKEIKTLRRFKPLTCRIRRDEAEMPGKGNQLKADEVEVLAVSGEKMGHSEQGVADASEAEMTLVWGTKSKRLKALQVYPEILSPATGKILQLTQKTAIVGRAPTCDLCLLDKYISRQHLEFSPTEEGFSLKNIGKNEIIVEKKIAIPPGHDTKSIAGYKGKILKPGDSTSLRQEAMIILGEQILYFFNAPALGDDSPGAMAQKRKYNIYKNIVRQQEELAEAGEFQRILTPGRKIFEDLGMGVWFKYRAIGDLCGDFFLYHKKQDALFLCMGDVSGHGAAAALWASNIAGMFKTLAATKENPQEIVYFMNEQLIGQKPEGKILYALANVIKVTSQSLEICIAGNYVPPLLYSAKTQTLRALNVPATPLGIMQPGQFKVYSGTLEFCENDMLILFTDGVIEALLSDGSQIGYQGAKELIEEQIRQKISQENFLDSFYSWLDRNSEIYDDLSMVLISKLGFPKAPAEF